MICSYREENVVAILDIYGIKTDGEFDLVASTLVTVVLMKCVALGLFVDRKRL